MSYQGRMQIAEHSPPLQTSCLHHRQQTLHETTAALTMTAEGMLSPQHPPTQQTLRMIIGRLDSFLRHQLPQPHLDVLQVGTKLRRLAISAAAPRLQHAMQHSYVWPPSNWSHRRF